MRHGLRGRRGGGVAERHEAEQGAARTACALKWGGASVARHREAAARQQGSELAERRSERTHGALKCLRARRAKRGGSVREREKRERKGVEREKRKSAV